MARYITTNIRFSPERYRELQLRASRDGKSVAVLVRDAVNRALGYEPDTAPAEAKVDPFFEVIGIGKGAEADGAAQHDHYLYGNPKEPVEPRLRRHRRAHRVGRS